MDCIMNKIRKNSIKFCLPLLIISLIFIIIGSLYYFSLNNKNIPEINKIDISEYPELAIDKDQQLLRKDLMNLKVQYIISNYMSDDKGQYYIVKMSDDLYISVYVPTKFTVQFNNIYDKSLSYGFGVYKSTDWKPVNAYGYLRKLNVEERCSMINSLLKINHMNVSSSEISHQICEYSFIFTYKYNYEFFPYFCFIVSVTCIIISIIFYIIFPAVYIGSYNLSKSEIAGISKDFSSGDKFSYITFGRKYIIFRSQKKLEFKNTIDLLWAYKINIKNKYFIVLYFSDGNVCRVKCRNKQEQDNIINYLKLKRPETQITYSEELENLYNSSIADFISKINHYDKGKR